MRAIEREVAAEDVVQEVFWRALASGMLRRFEDRGHGSLEAALCRILERTMIDVARRMRAEKRGGSHARLELGTKDENHDGIDRLPSADTTPTGSVRARELVELAGRVLDVREIQVWELIQLEGLDSVEVGERLGISASAVRGVLFRAQSKLVRAIGGELEQ